MVEKVLGKTGAPIKSQMMISKAVFQAALLYGSEIWVVMDTMMKILEGFHHSIARRILGVTVGKGEGGEWEWALVDATVEEIGIWTIREYVGRRQVKIIDYVLGIPI